MEDLKNSSSQDSNGSPKTIDLNKPLVEEDNASSEKASESIELCKGQSTSTKKLQKASESIELCKGQSTSTKKLQKASESIELCKEQSTSIKKASPCVASCKEEETTKKASESELSKETSTSQKARQSVKMYSSPKTIDTNKCPPKISFETVTKHEQETKVKRSDLTHISDRCNNFLDTLDTEVKASLYSLTINDVTDSKRGLEKIRRKAKAFKGQINMWMEDCLQRNAAAVQHSLKVEQHNKYLMKEKEEMQKEINQLKRTRPSVSFYDKKENEDIEKALLCSDSYFDEETPKKAKTDE